MTYPGTVPLSRAHLAHLAALLTTHRKAIGCRWRRLSAGRQALLVLAPLRNGDTYSRLAAGFGIGVATVLRYITEAVDLLTAYAPTLTEALWQLAWSDRPLAILDRTLIPTDRLGGANNRLYHSGKHHKHGVNLQGIINAQGRLLWVSDGLPGSVHDLTAARAHHITTTLADAKIQTLADKEYQGAGGTVTTPDQKQKSHRRAASCQQPDQPPPRARRTRLCHTEILEDLHQSPLLPTPRRTNRPSHPHPRTRGPN